MIQPEMQYITIAEPKPPKGPKTFGFGWLVIWFAVGFILGQAAQPLIYLVWGTPP